MNLNYFNHCLEFILFLHSPMSGYHADPCKGHDPMLFDQIWLQFEGFGPIEQFFFLPIRKKRFALVEHKIYGCLKAQEFMSRQFRGALRS